MWGVDYGLMCRLGGRIRVGREHREGGLTFAVRWVTDQAALDPEVVACTGVDDEESRGEKSYEMLREGV